jgi:hypothetical protein
MNNNFGVGDEVVKEHGGTATLFVKAGDDYVRVATNVKKNDVSRAIGTILDPHGPVIVVIGKGEAYYGDGTILSSSHTSQVTIRSGTHRVMSLAFAMSAIGRSNVLPAA